MLQYNQLAPSTSSPVLYNFMSNAHLELNVPGVLDVALNVASSIAKGYLRLTLRCLQEGNQILLFGAQSHAATTATYQQSIDTLVQGLLSWIQFIHSRGIQKSYEDLFI